MQFLCIKDLFNLVDDVFYSYELGFTKDDKESYAFVLESDLPIKVGSKLYRNVEFDVGDMIFIGSTKVRPKPTKVDGQWGSHPTEKEVWIEDMKTIRKGAKNDC